MIDKSEFNAGYVDGSEAFFKGEAISSYKGCQEYYRLWESYFKGRSESYLLGSFFGARNAEAFCEGSKAYSDGVVFCPYAEGGADEDLRGMWFEGYLSQSARVAV
ncbi:MAG: hypothetical protein PHH59_14430 [Methylovulum sp.]|uniref:hypothetical protein n=1 Tax=Methylovulum sp. TaxID=1916980 RepID=UPI0026296D58|nr:hypothetical protein [Methylovulum sp.]MDD2725201.1 hypothetical protein [Methylovulum sp.]MDD5125440.1 hypothetical protein [Methylovulum sp.]